jgi:hypothetical protein
VAIGPGAAGEEADRDITHCVTLRVGMGGRRLVRGPAVRVVRYRPLRANEVPKRSLARSTAGDRSQQ